MDSPKKQASKILRDKKMYQRWLAIFMCLALVVTSGTLTALKLTGQAWTGTEQVYACTYTPHQHTEQCYDAEGKLVCGYSDLVLHTHDARCYDSEGSLICTMEELEEHSHTSECYTEVKTLICTEEEHEAIPAHTHTDECYTTETVEQKDLTCGLEEGANAVEAQPAVEGHHHTDACYTITPAVEATYDEEGNELTAAVPEQRTLTCGLEESEGQPAVEAVPGHVHTEECYTTQQVEKQVLTCGLEEHDEEIPAHHHTDECYAIEMVLTCDKPEVIAHEHTDDCYEIELDEDGNEISRTLTCKLPQLVAHQHGDECFTEVALEAEGTYCGKEAHKHSGSCYMEVNGELVLTCDKEEHVHTDECFVEPAAEPMVQEYRGEDYTVTVSYDPAAFETEVSLNVREIAEGTEEYEQCYQQSLEATGSESLSFARFFDVTFADAEGNAVEPAEGYNVDVQIAYDQPVEIAENQNGQAVHFVEDEEGNVVTETPETAVEENTFNFSQGSFSVVGTVVGNGQAITGSESYFIYANLGNGSYALRYDGHAEPVQITNDKTTLTFESTTVDAEDYLWLYSSNKTFYNTKNRVYLSPRGNNNLFFTTVQRVDIDGNNNDGSRISGRGVDYYLAYSSSNSRFISQQGSSNAIRVLFARRVLPADSVTISGSDKIEVGGTTTLTAVVKDANGNTIRNPQGTKYEWKIENDDGTVTLITTSGPTCEVKGVKVGENATIKVTYTEDGAEPFTATHNVKVVASLFVDDGLMYNNGTTKNGLYQQRYESGVKVWWDDGILGLNNDGGFFTKPTVKYVDRHVASVSMTPSDYLGNTMDGQTAVTINRGDARTNPASTNSATGITLSQIFPSAKVAPSNNGNLTADAERYVSASKEDATYVKWNDYYYERGSDGWNNYANRPGATFYRRLVSSEYYGYANLQITPDPGYYVTKVTVGCMMDEDNHPYDCSRVQNNVALSVKFDLARGMNPSIVVRSDAFSHRSNTDYNAAGFYILIETAAIPSPLYVQYDPGEIVDGDETIAAETFFNFDSQNLNTNGAWLDNTNARYTVANNALVQSATVDKIVKTGRDNQGNQVWASGDLDYYPAGIDSRVATLAKQKGYRFIGWKVEYYDEVDVNDNNMEGIKFTEASGSGDTLLKQPKQQVTLATNARLIAQWELIPVAEVVKHVRNLPLTDQYTIKAYTFTVTKTPENPAESFTVKTQKFDSTGPVTVQNVVKFDENNKGTFTVEIIGNNDFACSIGGLRDGTYTVEETGKAGAKTVTMLPSDGTMEVKVAVGANEIQETATVTVTNDFAEPKGQLVEIEKWDASNNAYLPGATFTLTKDGDSTFTETLQKSDESGIVRIAKELENGTYTLTETGVPTGYANINSTNSIKFTVSNDNVVIASANAENAVILTTGENVTPKVYTVRVNNTAAPAKVRIFKHSSDTGLQGAEFAFYKANDKVETKVPGTEIKAEKIDDITKFANGYANLPEDLVLGETYYLVETKAPDGYNALAYPIKLTYTKGTDGFTLTATLTDGSELGLTPVAPVEGSDLWTLKVSNNPGTEMPHTGGMGTRMFTVGGGLLMILAAGLYFWNKRRISEM